MNVLTDEKTAWIFLNDSNIKKMEALIIENGGGSIKAVVATSPRSGPADNDLLSQYEPNIVAMPNAACRASSPIMGIPQRSGNVAYGSELGFCKDFSEMSFHRAHTKGYVTNWCLEQDIWTHLFQCELKIPASKLKELPLVTTAPPLNPRHMISAEAELVFEQFGFEKYAQVVGQMMPVYIRKDMLVPLDIRSRSALSSSGHQDTCSLDRKLLTGIVLDSGFSFTHAVPVINGRIYMEAIRRLDLGGKALTNQLKQVVSFRTYNMMRETAVMNAIKERLCYVSMNFDQDLAAARKGSRDLFRTYVLPDFAHGFNDPLGYEWKQMDETGADERQLLELGLDRISIPETLFRPADVGINQAGVAEIIAQSVEHADKIHKAKNHVARNDLSMMAKLYSNVIITGGNSQFPNFGSRLCADLRKLVPDDIQLKVYSVRQNGMGAIEGLLNFHRFHNDTLNQLYVSRADYQEHGPNICVSRFRTNSLCL